MKSFKFSEPVFESGLTLFIEFKLDEFYDKINVNGANRAYGQIDWLFFTRDWFKLHTIGEVDGQCSYAGTFTFPWKKHWMKMNGLQL